MTVEYLERPVEVFQVAPITANAVLESGYADVRLRSLGSRLVDAPKSSRIAKERADGMATQMLAAWYHAGQDKDFPQITTVSQPNNPRSELIREDFDGLKWEAFRVWIYGLSHDGNVDYVAIKEMVWWCL